MTLYLTDDTPPEEIARAKLSGRVHGVKLYPAGATTHSDAGVTRISRCFAALEKMEQLGLPLLIHGEVTDPMVDVFDREKAFVDEVLGPIVERFRNMKVVLEHITTRDAVQYVEVTGPNVAATITPHHLLLNRNALFLGGMRPHHYCLPVLKREEHREALVEAATSGNPEVLPRHRQRAAFARRPRKPPAAAPASTARTPRSSSTPPPSRKPARWTSWRASRATSAPSSTACRATRTRSRCCARSGPCRKTLRFGGEEAGPAARRRDDSVEAGLKHPDSSIRCPGPGSSRLKDFSRRQSEPLCGRIEAQDAKAASRSALFRPRPPIRTTKCTSSRPAMSRPVPDNKHDLFNALAWLAFPKTKARINAMHAAEIPREARQARPAARHADDLRRRRRDRRCAAPRSRTSCARRAGPNCFSNAIANCASSWSATRCWNRRSRRIPASPARSSLPIRRAISTRRPRTGSPAKASRRATCRRCRSSAIRAGFRAAASRASTRTNATFVRRSAPTHGL